MVTAAVEGDIDEAVALAILDHLGLELSVCHVNRGQGALLKRLPGFNEAARHSPWFVLTDLDAGLTGRCVGDFLEENLPAPADHMRLRVAVQQVEAWLLADSEALQEFLSVHGRHIPIAPDECTNAKEAMVNAGRKSRRRAIRLGMVPSPGSGRPVGPEYAGLMIEFALYSWRPGQARLRSPSLDRSLDRLLGLSASD